MDLVNNLIIELQNTEEKLSNALAILSSEITVKDSDVVVEASAAEFECTMVLSGATEDLNNLALKLEKEPGNEFLIKRLKAEAEKYKKYEVAL